MQRHLLAAECQLKFLAPDEKWTGFTAGAREALGPTQGRGFWLRFARRRVRLDHRDNAVVLRGRGAFVIRGSLHGDRLSRPIESLVSAGHEAAAADRGTFGQPID